MQNRFKSKAVWVAVCSFIILSLNQFGLLDNIKYLKEFVEGLLSLLVVLGILNNPADKNNF